MAYEIINRLRGTSVIRVADTGAVSINLSQLSANVNTENVYAAYISSMRWSTNATGSITITRQNAGSPANTIAALYGSGYWPHDDHNIANSATGNLTITVAGGGVGSLIMVMKKDANYNVQTQDL
jgi:hypothetical protein